MLLTYLKHWAPFRIDALGIVTLLGADQMDLVLGRLARTGFSNFLPLLGAYKIADNSVVKPIPGFILYNVTDGMLATDITGWFARWLLCQDLSYTSTTLIVSVKDRPAFRSGFDALYQYMTAILTMCPLLIVIILTTDWWGLANWVAMAISVVVRRFTIGQTLAALDIAACKSNIRANEPVKVLLTLPTGNLVVMKVPRGVVLHCLLTTPRPSNSQLYNFMRMVGWVGFSTHIICLGMTSLLNQLLAIALLLVSTVLVAQRIGDDETRIGSHLHIQREDAVGSDFRAAAMARMELSDTEEETMLAWNLFPQRSNWEWWQKYRVCQSSADGRAFRNWNRVLATPFTAAGPTTLTPATSVGI